MALPSLKELRCDGTTIGTLNASIFPALQYLDCTGANLTSLNVTGLTNLTYLSAVANSLTTIAVSTLSNLNHLDCSQNQMAAIDVSGLANLQYFHCWNNSLTSLNLTGATALRDFNCGSNQLSSLNLAGLTNIQTFNCIFNQFASLDISMLTSLSFLNCSYNLLTTLNCTNNVNLNYLACSTNQLVSLFIKNGSQESVESTIWNTNPTLQYICADDSQVNTLQAAAGSAITVNSYCTFSPGGNFNTITGTTIFDANNNGCDSGDAPQPFIKIAINDGTNQGATFTNGAGNYSFNTQAGLFVLTPAVENQAFFNFVPASATVNFPVVDGSVSNQSFCVSANGFHPDVEVVIVPITIARPGFNAVYKLVYKNKGNQPRSGSVTFQYDEPALDFLASSVTPNVQSSGNLSYDYVALMPFESREIVITFQVNTPADVPPVNSGYVLDFSASISPFAGDENPLDNVNALHQTVVNSFDPNNKICLEGETINPDKIGEYLHYNINFENVGTETATNIVVVDVIDISKYDLSTLQVMNSSHPVKVKIAANKVEFIFEGINLPPSSSSPIGGHGNVLFKIKSAGDLVSGDQVVNSANIYFDYNIPVATNEARTTYTALSNAIFIQDNSIVVYPNPAKNSITISAKSKLESILLYDVQGRILQTRIENSNKAVIDISTQLKGVYFVKITSGEGSRVEKIIKE